MIISLFYEIIIIVEDGTNASHGTNASNHQPSVSNLQATLVVSKVPESTLLYPLHPCKISKISKISVISVKYFNEFIDRLSGPAMGSTCTDTWYWLRTS